MDDNELEYGLEQQNQDKGKRNSLFYLGIIMIIIVIAAGIYLYSYVKGTALSPPYNGLNANLTSAQKLLISDLANANGTSGIGITYLEWNISRESTVASNITYATVTALLPNKTIQLAVADNQILTSYAFEGQSKAIWERNVTYRYVGGNYQGQIAAENYTEITYYNTKNATLICNSHFNMENTLDNTSLKCNMGYGTNTGFAIFPFSLTNVSWIGYMVELSNFTYQGQNIILGRPCDSFGVSNETSANQLNYTFDICVDKVYGVPLYYNWTSYQNGTINYTTSYKAIRISTNVSQSDFVIPQAMLNASQ